MAEDDKENEPPKSAPKPAPKAKRRASSGTPGGRWLALIPAVIAAVLFPLMMPRATIPRDVPLPLVDRGALARSVAVDRARAAAAREKRLPTDALAVGGALRKLNAAQAMEVPYDQLSERTRAISDARLVLDSAVRIVQQRDGWQEDLVSLRALQTDEFLAGVAHFESTGQETPELVEVGGAFVRHMREVGWADGNRIVLDEPQRRTMYKVVWNTLVGVTTVKEFLPTIDEERSLYILYLSRPHPPESMRDEIAAERRAATTPEKCAAAAKNVHRASELWRAEKIRALAGIDPSYPALYALGVAYFRAGRYESSVDAFRAYADRYPDGPYAIRARNHLKSAIEANAL